jgi:hypothetical protein
MKKENFMRKYVKLKKQGYFFFIFIILYFNILFYVFSYDIIFIFIFVFLYFHFINFISFRDNALAAHQNQYKNELENYKIYYEDKINGEKNKVFILI